MCPHVPYVVKYIVFFFAMPYVAQKLKLSGFKHIDP